MSATSTNLSSRELSSLNVAHIVYALHAVAIATAIITSATVVGSFLTSFPSIAAVILNYWKRSDAQGSWVAGHYRWQIRTFWFGLLWAVIGIGLMVTIIGIVFGFPILAVLTLWLIYRVARGWLRLRDGEPI